VEVVAGKKVSKCCEMTSNWARLTASGAVDPSGTPAEAPAAAAAAAAGAAVVPLAKRKRKRGRTELNDAARASKLVRSSKQGQAGPGKVVQEVPEHEKAQYLSMDCEMVGVGSGGRQSALAQCCLVGWDGEVVYKQYVRPAELVTDFRTFVSGVKSKHLKNAVSLAECQKAVASLLKGKILVGHALQNDLKALMLSHPKQMIRDTAKYRPFKRSHGKAGGKLRPRALKSLAKEFLGDEIQVMSKGLHPTLSLPPHTSPSDSVFDCLCCTQGASHDPAEDAKAAMDLYKLKRKEWELSLKTWKKGSARARKSVNHVTERHTAVRAEQAAIGEDSGTDDDEDGSDD
jgi:RNA exonuclease 4